MFTSYYCFCLWMFLIIYFSIFLIIIKSAHVVLLLNSIFFYCCPRVFSVLKFKSTTYGWTLLLSFFGKVWILFSYNPFLTTHFLVHIFNSFLPFVYFCLATVLYRIFINLCLRAHSCCDKARPNFWYVNSLFYGLHNVQWAQLSLFN